MYDFIIVRCCNYCSDPPKATGTSWGWTGTFDLIHSCHCYYLAAISGSQTQMSWGRCPGYVRGPLWAWHSWSPSVFNNLTRLIHIWMYVYRKHISRQWNRWIIKYNNPIMMMLGTCDIWSLLHSDTGTLISDPSEFYWSTYFSIDCQWWVTLVGRWLKYQTILIIIFV